MLKALLEFVLTRRAMVLAILLVFLGAGLIAFYRLNIEAYPDPAPPMMEIITQYPGQSAEEIERYITIPVEIAVAGMPGLRHVRSVSLYGLSSVKVQFAYGTNYDFDLQQTINRLATVSLPNNIQPAISPESAVGEVYRYQLVGPPGFSLMELKTLQDWVLKRRFKTVPGVIDVVGWGGLTKEYHVEIDLKKLVAFNATLPQVIAAIGNSNLNVGAQTLDIGEQAVNVRGIGLINSIDDINEIVLGQSGGVPIRVKDVARVEVGFTPRLGIAGRDHSADVVEGIVLMRHGEKTLDVLANIENEVARINKGGVLPGGVLLKPIYDRRHLVDVTTRTVLHNLVFGIVLVFLVQWIFLGDLWSALVVSATIPIALFFSVMMLVIRGESANLLSIGAIDFGIIVDATVIMVENVFRHLREGARAAISGDSDEPGGLVSFLTGKRRKILHSAVEVDKAIFFSMAVTIAAFIPLFTMQGVEGQIFAPMAKTYVYALVGALIACFTVSPVLSSVLLSEAAKERETSLVRHLRQAYVWLLRRALRRRSIAIVAAVLILAGAGLILPKLGAEFLPKLEEGDVWIIATLPPTSSLEAGEATVGRIREALLRFPEVITAISQHGRPDDGTDPSGYFNLELLAPLKPAAQWRPGLTKERLVEELHRTLENAFPGVRFSFSQNIQANVEEAVSGVKGENSVKLFGPDLKALEDKAREIQAQMATVQGVEDLEVVYELGQPNLLIEVDRRRAARYGLTPGDVNAVVQSAIGGQLATQIYEGERQFPLVVRLMPEYRRNIDAIRSIPVGILNPGGGAATYVPLDTLATVTLRTGASYIYRENYARYIAVKFSVRGRDLGGAVGEAQAKVEKNVRLPEGYRMDWTGEFGAYKAAQQRMAVIVPVSLLLILTLLYSMFNSLRYSLLALSGIPFAVSGGIVALYLTGEPFSISAAVGFISLFGVSVMVGILILTYYNRLRESGFDREEAMRRTAEVRMRPVMMMGLSACIGLLPAALSTGIGSQVQRPLAVVIVGGMLLIPLIVSWVLPVLLTFLLPRDASVVPGTGEKGSVAV